MLEYAPTKGQRSRILQDWTDAHALDDCCMIIGQQTKFNLSRDQHVVAFLVIIPIDAAKGFPSLSSPIITMSSSIISRCHVCFRNLSVGQRFDQEILIILRGTSPPLNVEQEILNATRAKIRLRVELARTKSLQRELQREIAATETTSSLGQHPV